MYSLIEIDQLDLRNGSLITLLRNKNVFEFYITVNNFVLVQVLQRLQNLNQYLANVGLLQVPKAALTAFDHLLIE